MIIKDIQILKTNSGLIEKRDDKEEEEKQIKSNQVQCSNCSMLILGRIFSIILLTNSKYVQMWYSHTQRLRAQ